MSSSGDTAVPTARDGGVAERDVLREPAAGGMVIRGGLIRLVGFGAGILLGALASVFLLRHLGVTDFGRYVTVMSLVSIVSGITDAGLTVVGSRELAVRPPGAERRRLVESLVGIRLLLTPLGIVAAVAFALVAGYDGRLVLGTVLAGAGIVLLNAHGAMVLPLSVELKNGRLAVAELVKQAVTTAAIMVLALAGASLLPFFAVQILVGAVALAFTPLLLGTRRLPKPRVEREVWRDLFVQALPLAAAFVLGIIYFRILVIMVSLMASEYETGLFSTSFRVLELLLNVPLLLAGVVLPVAAAAAHDDPERFRYVMQRVTEVALVGSVGVALVTAIAAEPVIVLLGGEEYRGAASILALQAFALVGVFMSQTFNLGLLAIRRQRDIAVAAGVGLLSVAALGAVLIPLFEGHGAAAAAVIADLILALTMLLALRRAGPGRELRLGGQALKVLAAAAVAGSIALIPAVPQIVLAAVSGLLYVAVAWGLGAVPAEALAALRSRDPGARPSS